MSFDPMVSPIAPSLISSTTLSLLGLAGTSASLSSVSTEKGKKSPAPTLCSSQASPMTPQEAKFAEEPIHKILGKSIKDMNDQELQAHCEYLRSLRKSPQTLQAKVKKDEELLDGMYGVPEDKKIRSAVVKTLEEKTKSKGRNAEAQGAKLASKWANFAAVPAAPTTTPPPTTT